MKSLHGQNQGACLLPRICFSLLLLVALQIPLFSQVGEQALLSSNPGYTLDEALLQLAELPGGGSQEPELRWDPLLQSGVLLVNNHRIAFAATALGRDTLIIVDSRTILSAPSPFLDKGQLFFPEAFLSAIKRTLSPEDPYHFRVAAIIVDPGHGGRDNGAVGTHLIRGETLQLREKDITLMVSLDLYSRLKQAFPDKQILLTRDRDYYPSLEDRVVTANSVDLRENEAIVFISIHANASFNKAARGHEVWYLSPDYRRTVIDAEKYTDAAEVIPILNAMLEEEFTTESIMIAQAITRKLEDTLGDAIPSRGIKAEEWFVVRNAQMPSVLVELGFVTNEEDALLLSNPGYLNRFSEAIYKGIVDFVTNFENSRGFTAIQ